MKIIRFTAAFAAVLMMMSCMSSCRKTGDAETTETEETTEAETTAEIAAPQFANPLTGLESAEDLSRIRPVSIMVNNIHVSLPQEGISEADIMYECLAEGGITRLMMISTDYAKLTKIGSVRSARHYYIDFAEGYDCIFVHAGGSTFAYDTFEERGTDHIDGVKGPSLLFNTTNTFIRDPERLKTYSSEHTLMVQDGAGLTAAVEYYKFRTEKNAGYETPMNFAPWGSTAVLSDKASHIHVTMSNYQLVDYVFKPESSEYLRYQYDGEAHMDNTNGEQLAFDNVLVVFTDTSAIAGDEKDRINITTTGEGDGWFATGGGYKRIKWKKENHDSVTKYYYEDGTEVELNRGKTMINVVPSYEAEDVTFDDNTANFAN